MNRKRFIVASFVIFVAYEFLTSFINVIVFGGLWEVGFTFGDLAWSFLFVFIFAKGYERRGLPEGLRFGLLIGVFFCSPIIFGFLPLEQITNVNPDLSDWILPGVIPSIKALSWFGLSIIKISICGILAALIYKP